MRGDLMMLLGRLLGSDDRLPRRVQQMLRLDIFPKDRRKLLVTAAIEDDELALDMVHLCLTEISPSEAQHADSEQGRLVVDLHETLDRCQSVWSVAISGTHFGLQRRVDPTVRDAAETAMAHRGTAAEHLREAWTACYQRDADADRAMRFAVFALEAALAPVATPNDVEPSLGKIANTMRDAPHKWTLPLDDTRASRDHDAVSAPITLANQLQHVWRTHRRHIDVDGNASGNEPSEAEAAVHVAVNVVHLVQRGLLSITDGTTEL
jgi:hypothetical protein